MNDSDLEQQARNAVAEAIGYHTVAIDFSRAAKEKDKGWGTGSFVRIGGKYFIVTCKHVVKPEYKSEDLRYLYKGGESFRWVDKEVITKGSLSQIERIIDKKFPSEIPILNRIYSDDLDDFVLLEIGPCAGEIGSNKFLEIKSNDVRGPEANTLVYFMGFSTELTRVVTKKGELGLFIFYGVSSIIDKEINASDFDPKRHFLIDFGPTETGDTIDPHGLSGCGVWARSPSGKDRLWTPNIYLIGIQHGYFRRSRVLKATNINQLIRLATNG